MIRINLLPEEERGKKARKRPSGLRIPSLKIPMVPQTIWVLSIVGILAVVFLSLYLSRIVAIGRMNKEIVRMENRLAKLQKEADLVRDLETKEKELQSRLGVINRLNRDRFTRVKMLDDLCTRVPDYIWLTALEEVSSQARITGLTFSNLTVARFMEELSASEYFEDPELISLRKKTVGGQDVMEFLLTVPMKHVSPQVEERRRPRRGSG